MSIDEAIKHSEEVAEKYERHLKIYENMDDDLFRVEKNECKNCAKEHRQLAGWLKELKQLREQTRWIPVSERLPEWPCAVCDINENLPTIPTGLFTTPDKEVIDASRLDKLLKLSGLPDSMTFLAAPASVTDEQRHALKRIVHHNRITAWMPLPRPFKAESEG